MKKIVITTLHNNTAKFYCSEIKKIFREYVDVVAYSFENGTVEKGFEADVLLTSSFEAFEALKVYLKTEAEIIVANRTLSKKAYKILSDLKSEEKVLLVNASAEAAVDTVSTIYQLGLSDIEFIPVYPGVKSLPHASMAVTPGESRYVPKGIDTVIDIGNRVLDISTIIHIAEKLDLNFILAERSTRKYFENIVPLNDGLEKMIGNTHRLESQYEILLEILEEAIIGVSKKGRIYTYNESAQNIIGKTKNEVIGYDVRDILPEIPFEDVLVNNKPIIDKLLNISNVNYVVTIVPVVKNKTLYGAVANIRKFSDTERKQHKLRAQLIGKGHRAKYTFGNIIGENLKLQRCKDIAKRMAKSESSILIVGESGTGKELFAQAIHNSSSRKDYQFVAVNCAALPANLMESELFGYEEGAFTGARKGGKLGLFELAHKGTLFLDEIAEMPLHLQARLLRVLQEKEVMRIGGDRVINIDVRIIAATNRILEKEVEEGNFRKDLYYRLNVIPLKIPPLRERKEDIPIILQEIKRELNSNFEITQDALKAMMDYDWNGNIRELKNCIEYLTNLGENLIIKELLPENIFSCKKTVSLNIDEIDIMKKILREPKADDLMFLLGELKQSFIQKIRLGRRSLEEVANQKGRFLTEHEIRDMLIYLRNKRCVEIGKGRGGTKITHLGMKIYDEYSKGLMV